MVKQGSGLCQLIVNIFKVSLCKCTSIINEIYQYTTFTLTCTVDF